MSDVTLDALIEEGKAINADITESMKRDGLAGVGLNQIRSWRDSSAIYIAAKDATLGAQVPVIPAPAETDDIVKAAARTQAILEALKSNASAGSAESDSGVKSITEYFLSFLPKNRFARFVVAGALGLVVLAFVIWASLSDDQKNRLEREARERAAAEAKKALEAPNPGAAESETTRK